jgi:uncharacterized protein with HEPN domain
MRDHAQSGLDFLQGRSKPDIDADKMLRFALTRAVEVVGEAAAQVDPADRTLLPQLPWRSMIAMRNRLIHGYASLQSDYLFNTVRDDFPPLIDELDKMLGIATP